MKRNKIITVRVDQKLYLRTLDMIEKKTVKRERNGKKTYWNTCYGYTKNRRGKFTVADLLEAAMEQFLKIYEENDRRSL